MCFFECMRGINPSIGNLKKIDDLAKYNFKGVHVIRIIKDSIEIDYQRKVFLNDKNMDANLKLISNLMIEEKLKVCKFSRWHTRYVYNGMFNDFDGVLFVKEKGQDGCFANQQLINSDSMWVKYRDTCTTP